MLKSLISQSDGLKGQSQRMGEFSGPMSMVSSTHPGFGGCSSTDCGQLVAGPPLEAAAVPSLGQDLDHLADFVQAHIDLAGVDAIIEQGM